MRSAGRALFPLIVIVLLVYLAGQTILPANDDRDRITYGDLITRVEGSPESIVSVLFIPRSQEIRVTLADGSKLESNYPTEASQLEFQHLLHVKRVKFDSKGTGGSAWWSILTYLLPFALFGAFWIFLLRQRRTEKPALDDPGASVGRREPF